MKKIRGWHDAAFRLGQETHQIPFVNLKRTRWASRSKSRSGSQNISSLALYRRRIPNRVFTSYNIYNEKLLNTCEKFVAGLTRRFVSAKRLIRYLS